MSVINYKNETAKAQARADAARVDAQNSDVWGELLNRFLIADVQANYGLLRDYSPQMTLESCEYLIKTNPKSLAWTTREALVSELATMLRENTTQKTLSDYDWKSKVVRMSTWGLKQLRGYKRELLFKQSHQTAEKARAYLAEVRKPVNDVQVLPMDITASAIKRMHPQEIRRLVRDYTVQAVNNRIFGRS